MEESEVPQEQPDIFIQQERDPRLDSISVMLEVLATISEISFLDNKGDELYERSGEHFVKVLSNAMRIIIKKQSEILKDA